MKKSLNVLIGIVFSIVLGCNSDTTVENAMNNNNNGNNTSNGSLDAFSGNFVSDAHTTSGVANVNNKRDKLTLKNFKTDDGPKLLVYLSTEVSSNDFVNLGDLKGLVGNFEYDIPDNTDLTKYKYVVIWCIDATVSFGHAELKK